MACTPFLLLERWLESAISLARDGLSQPFLLLERWLESAISLARDGLSQPFLLLERWLVLYSFPDFNILRIGTQFC